MKPQIIEVEKELPEGIQVVDAYDIALEELFVVDNPSLKNAENLAELQDEFKQNFNEEPIWVYYPWRNLAVKTVSEDLYFKLRSARNKNLITAEEQVQFRSLKVGIIGMSIGSATLDILVRMVGPKTLKIADFDTIEITNLNRMNGSLPEVGLNKASTAAQRAYEIDPFLDLHVYDKEITKENLVEFLENPKLDVVVDAMDSLDMKVLLRKECKERGVCVLMGTTNSDSVIIDIERYDVDSETKIFHGVLDREFISELLANPTKSLEDYNKWLKLATKIVDPNLLLPEMSMSVKSVGKEIAGVPQLATSVYAIAVHIGYLIKLLALNKLEKSGRHHLVFSSMYD